MYRLDIPLVEIAIEPRSATDNAWLAGALALLSVGEPSCCVTHDDETGQTRLSAPDERGLADMLDRLRGIDVQVGPAGIVYRETVSRVASATYLHKRQTSGPGQFARVTLSIEPGAISPAVTFEDRTAPDHPAKDYVPAVERGARTALAAGPVAGWPVIGVTVALTDGLEHPVDSNQRSFEIAARAATCDGLRRAGPRLLEPIAAVEVVVPKTGVGTALGELNRRGVGLRERRLGGGTVLEGTAPLVALLGVEERLGSLSSGEAQVAIAYLHHAPVAAAPSGSTDPDDDAPIAAARRT
ncbi:MAG: hypothetical protein ACFBWO_16815 [Paracoccaceae bacterium]